MTRSGASNEKREVMFLQLGHVHKFPCACADSLSVAKYFDHFSVIFNMLVLK